MLSVLIVDDELSNREILFEIINRHGHKVDLAEDGRVALQKAMQNKYDLILSDIRMPNYDGIEFFNAYHSMVSQTNRAQFAFMTAYGKIDEAIDLMRKGALHFLTKPLKKKDITKLIDEVVQTFKNTYFNKDSNHKPLGNSHYFKNVIDTANKIAATNANVLLVGESGTGKEVIANYIHSVGNRSNQKFVAFHSASVPESLIESELFGYEKGAFTGATHSNQGLIRSADLGTFFIDEISSMPISTQTKLIRVIQNKEIQPLGSTKTTSVNVRWIAATNIDLNVLVSKGLFREDLLFRLNVIQIKLPALRERRDDIIFLAETFIDEFCKRENKSILNITNEVKNVLENYYWPGNIRELRNVIERAVILSNCNELGIELLPEHLHESKLSHEIKFKVGSTLQSVEDELIEKTLHSCNGDKNAAAIILGVAPRTIYRWIEKNENKL